MKNILITIADSIPSENKWKEVLSIAQSSKASLTIMHVMADTTSLLNAVDRTLERNHGIKFPKQELSYYKKQEKQLQDFIDNQDTIQFQPIKITGLVKIGEVIDTILAEEQTGKYDLLILGTAPKKFLWNRIMGSVSKTVMNKSQTPVFLVPRNSHFLGIDKIVYATNVKYDEVKIHL